MNERCIEGVGRGSLSLACFPDGVLKLGHFAVNDQLQELVDGPIQVVELDEADQVGGYDGLCAVGLFECRLWVGFFACSVWEGILVCFV